MKENRVKTISLLFLMVSGLILGASVVEAGGDHHHGIITMSITLMAAMQ